MKLFKQLIILMLLTLITIPSVSARPITSASEAVNDYGPRIIDITNNISKNHHQSGLAAPLLKWRFVQLMCPNQTPWVILSPGLAGLLIRKTKLGSEKHDSTKTLGTSK